MVRHLTPRPDSLLCAALAADLDAADLRSEPLRDAWGAEADDALARGIRSPLLRALAARTDPLATLGRLFVLGMPQPLSDVASALPRTGVDGVEELGLAYRSDDLVVPAALIRPQSFVDADGVGEWWIASDLDELALQHLDEDGVLPPDHVLGVGGASRTLASLVMPIEVERALDLGTGCGIQALLVSRHAGSVVATDISERALAYAELNAMLAGVHNIEFRLGSLFEPVAGESFGLIVSNPPFVITPRGADVPEYEYRDGGLVGDALVEAFVRTAPQHLVPGGSAQLLGNWESIDPSTGPGAGATGSETGALGMRRLESWIDPALDAWVVQRETLSPLGYAELWIRDGGTTPRDPAFDSLLDAWLDDFDARGVTEIGFGYVLIRRPAVRESGTPVPPLRRFETIAQAVTSAGRAFRDGLAGHDALADGVPDRLLVAPDVTEARHHIPGQDAPSVIELRQGGGFGRTMSVDPALAGFVGVCDGELTVGQITSALAELFEVPPAALWADLEPRLRTLVTDGFLVPADPDIAE
ncbi:methyltransferase [Microbacterium sp.]|uniref:DUF7059 domain-containing protein n=1 Tax=Microbacterium sp. TaxID=51671 RepID=UPI0025F63F53|nr:methyltransferase [Microbacterium sp.]